MGDAVPTPGPGRGALRHGGRLTGLAAAAAGRASEPPHKPAAHAQVAERCFEGGNHGRGLLQTGACSNAAAARLDNPAKRAGDG